MNNVTQALSVAFMDPLTTLANKFAAAIPNIVASLLILIIGYFVAKFIAYIVLQFIEKTKLEHFVAQSGLMKFFGLTMDKINLAKFLSKLSFYILMVTFVMSAAEMLNLNVMADALKVILLYLPNIFAALVVLLFGFYIANIAQNVITEGAKGMNIDFAVPLGKTAYVVIAIISMSLGIAQLGIETYLLNEVAGILLIAVAASLALSVGLGTRELSSQIVAGTYVRDLYKTGDRIEVDGIKGIVKSVGTAKTVIATDNGQEVSLSNEELLKSKVIKG